MRQYFFAVYINLIYVLSLLLHLFLKVRWSCGCQGSTIPLPTNAQSTFSCQYRYLFLVVVVTVGQVASRRQVQSHDSVVRPQESRVHREVGRAARVRLHLHLNAQHGAAQRNRPAGRGRDEMAWDRMRQGETGAETRVSALCFRCARVLGGVVVGGMGKMLPRFCWEKKMKKLLGTVIVVPSENL